MKVIKVWTRSDILTIEGATGYTTTDDGLLHVYKESTTPVATFAAGKWEYVYLVEKGAK